MESLVSGGAAGEICGWMFDHEGRLLSDSINRRVASVPIPAIDTCCVIGLAQGPRKLVALRAALKGQLINGLITDENTAEQLLA